MNFEPNAEQMVEALKKSGVSEDGIQQAIKLSQENKTSLGAAITSLNLLSNKAVTSTIASAMNVPFVDVAAMELGPGLAHVIPEKVARQYMVIAIVPKDGELTLVMSDPLNMEAIEDVKALTGRKVTPALCQETDILAALFPF